MKRALPLLMLLVIAGAGAWLLQDILSFDTLKTYRTQLLDWQSQHPFITASLFSLAYITIVAFSLPGAAVASLTGGFIFGMILGTTLNVISATIGASLIFLIAKTSIGDTLSHHMDTTDGTIKRIKTSLNKNQISVLLLLRLVPAVPFFVANLIPAFAGIRLFPFFWTTLVGILPGAAVYTFIGVGLGDVFDRNETPNLSLIWDPYILGPILALAALVALPMIVKQR